MIKYGNPLLDTEFLNKLASQHEREISAKIIALDMDENPIEEIDGRITQGSVPVDGNSIVRRTCSLSLVANELNINDYIWGLNTKVKLEIGLRNKIDPQYPPIVWFKMGVFILTSFSSQHSSSGYTVSLQGKDKMCLLNGDVGGNLTALSYDFGEVSVINKNGYTTSKKIPIKQIIKKAVHDFGKEPYQNIIINDLDDSGLELLEYRGDDPLYFIYSPSTQEVSNMVIDQNQQYYLKGQTKAISIRDMENANSADKDQEDLPYKFRSLADLGTNDEQVTEFYGDSGNNQKKGPYNIIKITKGMTCGYRTTDLVYAGNLVSSVNDTVASMLSKIVSMLGNYEYFYNVDGQFVFQRKRTYVNTSWNNMVNNGEEKWVDNAAYTASYVFSFEDGNLITSYQNSPNLLNLRNDYSIWGTRKGASGNDIPIHLRYAIDHKPTYYTTYDGVTYTTKSESEVEEDKKEYNIDIDKGFVKEKSRFGLSEDWWEVRDWAKAWKISGLPTPTEPLRTYCPIRARITNDFTLDGQSVANSTFYSYVPKTETDKWNCSTYPFNFSSDDIIFNADGTYNSYHGRCSHSYTTWLEWFTDPESKYYGGYAYFYKPQVPADVIAENGKKGLDLGKKLYYNQDWRELIYQMAEDFKKHGDEDDFVATIREKNIAWYPTGYTGYEQYYVDLDGFWRELYDPDYTTSYDAVHIAQRQFVEESKYGQWYYNAPQYTQCRAEDRFYPTVSYYIRQGDKFIEQKNLSQVIYGKNPTQYYIVSGTKIAPIPLTTEPYSSNNSYWERGTKGYTQVTGVTASTYNSINTSEPKSAINLYLRQESYHYYPCVKLKEWRQAGLYFEKSGDSYKPNMTITESDYMAHPGKYYYRGIEGGQIKFYNCATITAYDSGRKYFQKNSDNTYTQKDLTESEYNSLNYSNPYYYAETTYSFLPCIHPSIKYDSNETYYKAGIKEYVTDEDSPYRYWNKRVLESPETLNFWFDFLDTYGELSQFAVKEIGDRPKAVNDKDVKAIYYRETPGVIFVKNLNDLEEKKSGYTYAQLPTNLEYLFSISGQGKSAKDELDSYLYSYAYCAETISISAIPVYHLEPNTRIFVRDDSSGINGEYIVTRINFPLSANGTMSITATKVVDRIY